MILEASASASGRKETPLDSIRKGKILVFLLLPTIVATTSLSSKSSIHLAIAEPCE